MKIVVLFFSCLLMFNCGSRDTMDKELSWQDEYELITRIKFPKKFKIIANPPLRLGELVRKTIIEFDKKECKDFYSFYGFQPISDTISPFGSRYMDSIYRLIPDRTQFLHKFGKKYASPTYFKYDTDKNTNWLYLLDTTTCRLYCLISYPNHNGYAK